MFPMCYSVLQFFTDSVLLVLAAGIMWVLNALSLVTGRDCTHSTSRYPLMNCLTDLPTHPLFQFNSPIFTPAVLGSPIASQLIP